MASNLTLITERISFVRECHPQTSDKHLPAIQYTIIVIIPISKILMLGILMYLSYGVFSIELVADFEDNVGIHIQIVLVI